MVTISKIAFTHFFCLTIIEKMQKVKYLQAGQARPERPIASKNRKRMIMKQRSRRKISHGQMSEAFATAAFLSVSGGLQDAYTYLFRGKVFANAQTGNIVLLSQCVIAGQWSRALHYLIPLLSFALGVFAAELIRGRFQYTAKFHWRQLVLLTEILLLFVVGFLPTRWNMLANSMVSFSCAMQVQAFRKVSGYPFASTMCIGNLRSCMESLTVYLRLHHKEDLKRARRYAEIIVLFAIGAGVGGAALSRAGAYTIWISCCLLVVSLCLMFIREEEVLEEKLHEEELHEEKLHEEKLHEEKLYEEKLHEEKLHEEKIHEEKLHEDGTK